MRGLAGRAKFVITGKKLPVDWDKATDKVSSKEAGLIVFTVASLVLSFTILPAPWSFVVSLIPALFLGLQIKYQDVKNFKVKDIKANRGLIKQKFGKRIALVVSTILGSVAAYSYIPAAVLPLVFAVIPVGVILYLKAFQDVTKENMNSNENVNRAIWMNVILIPLVLSGIIIWHNYLLVWSFTYILMPFVSIVAPLFRQPALAMKIYKGEMERRKRPVFCIRSICAGGINNNWQRIPGFLRHRFCSTSLIPHS